jgi:hypothetical protein
MGMGMGMGMAGSGRSGGSRGYTGGSKNVASCTGLPEAKPRLGPASSAQLGTGTDRLLCVDAKASLVCQGVANTPIIATGA